MLGIFAVVTGFILIFLILLAFPCIVIWDACRK